jgi:hypothetical protein
LTGVYLRAPPHLRSGDAHHIPQRDYEQFKTVDATVGRPCPVRIGLLTTITLIAVNLGPCAPSLVAPAVAVSAGCNLRNRLRLQPKVLDLRLDVFNLSHVKLVEGIEVPAKVEM